DVEQSLASGSGPGAGTARPGFQLLPKRSAQPAHITSKRRRGPGAVPPPVPPAEEHLSLLQQQLSHGGPRPAAVNHGLKISPQMGPAKLAALQRLAVVRLRPIAGQACAVLLSHT